MMSKDAPVGCGEAAQYCSLSQQFDLATKFWSGIGVKI
jgi:hypothetical protein